MSSKSYIVTLKDTVSEASVNSFKQSVQEIGGKIVDEFTLIKGFTVELPGTVQIQSLEEKNSETIQTVEVNGEVSIN
ncbi:hypothetical protein TBLA_0B06100 [Henningerozyma blattae CBS 6284]|uniref:Inhibitor I9 domain-containing protein n=1 Tax=Henningerozyma blattae (strain ATCC 34711 / CBS 6284 / DSM 70876 / NBRC 10599 / NRRL Y-10934 / UCD 77-7) TaxID=1071380 RepID=I2GZ84_HENB6|nr:hypothetical protein TBLA_0B06100 [Tetrapisispora blattae CBS 6284]CCH59436.1 hypothetical protein TBLA_0B06100 [Tetrapisispora blattae CBS 6284]